jgi:hypothetical protein
VIAAVAPREHVSAAGRKVVAIGVVAVILAAVLFVLWLKRGSSDDD